MVSADASSYGLGAALTQQKEDQQWKPVAYASRALTPTKERYAEIEKEALGITWACERFREYLVGMQFRAETDHKPLVALLGEKNLEELSPRLQRFCMRLIRYKFTISHLPGRELTVASRAPASSASSDDIDFHKDTEMFVNLIIPLLSSVWQS